jgi:flagella basal body P-ring formation protein FlgA
MQRFIEIISIVLGLVTVAANSHAAELRLRSDAKTTGSVVRLGDVADILDGGNNEVQALSQIELSPAPGPGKQRTISVREIQDTLERRGVNMLQLRVTGASQVNVAGYVETAKTIAKSKLLPLSSMQEAQRAVIEAIVRHLQEAVGNEDPWSVTVELSDAQAQAVLTDVHHVQALGGKDPWFGRQTFEITARTDKGPTVFNIEAKVTIPSSVVVTAKAVPRGAILEAADVTLQRIKPGTQIDDEFQSVDDVIGREAVRAIAQGQVLDPQYVRTPIFVKRGSVVTVYVQSPGIKIRMTGRARENGGQGDTVTIESLLDKKSFEARVTGIDQVEVTASPSTQPERQIDKRSDPTPSSVNESKSSTRVAAARRNQDDEFNWSRGN